MEPASRETGMCGVRDDKSRPNGQTENASTHLHLIHQPSLANEPPPTTRPRAGLQEPLWLRETRALMAGLASRSLKGPHNR